MKRDPPPPYNPLSAIPLPPIPDNANFVTLKGGGVSATPLENLIIAVKELFVTLPHTHKVHF